MSTGSLTLLQINDTHGYLEPHPELVWRGGEATYPVLGGYARIAALFKRIRNERQGAVIALDNGDTLHGTYPAVISKGQAFVPRLNALELDAMTAHWEFAFGPAHLRRLSRKLSYPLLAVNCYDKETGQLIFPPSRVLERGGLRVGIVGIAATIVDEGMPPAFSEGVRFTLGRDELASHIAHLRDKNDVDIVVVLSHLGFPQDVRLASEVPVSMSFSAATLTIDLSSRCGSTAPSLSNRAVTVPSLEHSISMLKRAPLPSFITA